MKILGKYISIYWVIIIACAGVLTGSVIATTVTPIWSNVTSSNILPQIWSGTIVSSNNVTIGHTGDSITLTATLNPLPNQYQMQQNVTFWYSATPITLDNNGAPTNPSQLTNLPASNSNSGVWTIAGVAHLTFVAQTTGQFYFIAEVSTPT